MKFSETSIKGAFLIDLECRQDHRGFFARSWCATEYATCGLNPNVAQINVAFTLKRGTIRGLHYQLSPHQEAKTVRCTRGSIFDVVVDLRPGSPTHKQWRAFELTPINHHMLYVPEGCAHGYQTLLDETEIEYLTTTSYAPQSARGVRFDDAAFSIEWPLRPDFISDSDQSWPDYRA